MDQERILYRVQYWMPVPEGTTGGLFWGTTVIEPGKIGDEYFMTHGHLHKEPDRAEYYATIRGEGALILMDQSGACRFEKMQPGTVHYIPGHTAHRVANIGGTELAFLGCWPSDAGHDYDIIRNRGFSARLREVNGRPALISEHL
jgi:glucose-6-phosphate isomerase